MTNGKYLICFSMYRFNGSDVSAPKSRTPLSKSSRSIHQLYVRGRKPRTDMVTKRQLRPELSAVHQGSNRLRADIACGCEPDRVAEAADNQGSIAFQAQHTRSGIRPDGYVIENELLGDASITR